MFVFQRQERNEVVNEVSINQGAVPKSTCKGKEKRFVSTSLVKHYHRLNGSKGQNTAKNPRGILEVYNAQVNTSPFSCYFVHKVLDRHINVVLQAE